MNEIYYNGTKKAFYTDNSLKWISNTDKEIFEPMFEQNQGIIQEEDDEGNVIFKSRPLSVTEKLSILLDMGFTLDKKNNDKEAEVKGQKVLGIPKTTAVEGVIENYYKEFNDMVKEVIKKA